MLHTITNLATIIIQLKTKEEMIIFILRNFVNLRTLKNAQREINAVERITELNACTTRTSIKQSFVTDSHTKFHNVSTESIAHLLTLLRILKSGLFTTWCLRIPTLTSISSFLKQNGVPIIMSITKLNAFTPIIFKILEENPTYFATKLNYAKIGRVEPLLPVTRRDVKN